MQHRIFSRMISDSLRHAGLIMCLAVGIAVAMLGASGVPGGEPALAHTAKGSKPLRGWAGGFTLTQYHPTPEFWFGGPARELPGIEGRHRVAWLLSANGVAMQGSGWSRRETGPGTRSVSYLGGGAGWLNERGRKTDPGGSSGWTNGAPAWLECGWQNRRGRWTFPLNYLDKGEPLEWARGRPARWAGCDAQFGAGAGRPVRFWNSVAVDPGLFPIGRTWFYLPVYRNTRCDGWFRADDTGGAVSGRHLDVYRPPPKAPGLTRTRTGQRVLIVRGRKPRANPCR